MGCCGREIVSGRFSGSSDNPPVDMVCQFGCPSKILFGKNVGHKLHFVRYQEEHTISEDLMKTWIFRDRSGNLWGKYSSEKSDEQTTRRRSAKKNTEKKN